MLHLPIGCMQFLFGVPRVEHLVTIKLWPEFSHRISPHQFCKYNSGKIRTPPPSHKFCHQKPAHWNYATEKSAQPKMFCHYTKWSNQQLRQIPEFESTIRIELTLRMMIISSTPVHGQFLFLWATHSEHWWSYCEASESSAFFGFFSVFFLAEECEGCFLLLLELCCCCCSTHNWVGIRRKLLL